MQDVNGEHHDHFVNHAGRLADALVHAVTTNIVLTGIAREAIKDVRNMFMEVFFGRGERGGEPGTPLNPLYYDLVAARKSEGPAAALGPSLTESILADPGRYHQPPESGPEHPQQQDPGREL